MNDIKGSLGHSCLLTWSRWSTIPADWRSEPQWSRSEPQTHLEGSQQLVAALNAGNVKEEVKGSRCYFRTVFCICFNGVEYLIFILTPCHLVSHNRNI